MLHTPLRPYEGVVLFQAPNRRQKLARRRAYLTSAFVGVALASAAVGVVANHRSVAPQAVDAENYFPSQ
jgi:nitrous oxide reductase